MRTSRPFSRPSSRFHLLFVCEFRHGSRAVSQLSISRPRRSTMKFLSPVWRAREVCRDAPLYIRKFVALLQVVQKVNGPIPMLQTSSICRRQCRGCSVASKLVGSGPPLRMSPRRVPGPLPDPGPLALGCGLALPQTSPGQAKVLHRSGIFPPRFVPLKIVHFNRERT
jgi:hypothetical protein